MMERCFTSLILSNTTVSGVASVCYLHNLVSSLLSNKTLYGSNLYWTKLICNKNVSISNKAVSAYMAKQFNALTPTWTKSVEFLEVSVIQVNQPDGTPIYYNVEVLLEDYKTNYMKWNNNSGYVNLDEFAATLDAFCHWTYDVTEGYPHGRGSAGSSSWN